MLSDVDARAVQVEYIRRHQSRGAVVDKYKPTQRERKLARELRGTWFAPQARFFQSTARRRVGFCTRRAGKTLGTAIWFLENMLEHPGSLNLYIAQTAGAARVYMWRELKKLVNHYDLPFRFNETNLYMQHKRGEGLLLLKGADKADEIEKLRGPKWSRVCLDEAQLFGAWMENLINEVLGAALRDEAGHLIMTGTAGKKKEGIFYEASHGLRKRRSGEPVYELHRWSLQDNPFLSAEAKDEELIIDEEGYSGPEDPRFQREYRGEWVVGDSERMFAFDEKLNTYDGPIPGGHDWKTGHGCDFGWHDQTAFVTGVWCRTSPVFYVPESWGRSHQYTDDVAARAMELQAKYGSKVYVGDTGGYGKNVCVHLARDYGINVLQAHKREKFDHIAFFNSALRRGHVKIKRGDRLCKQLQEVAWNENRTDAANHSRDDLCFALLYIWRYAKNYGMGREVIPNDRVEDPMRARATREKMEALNDRGDKRAGQPAWTIGETGSIRNSARYSSPAWRALLGHR